MTWTIRNIRAGARLLPLACLAAALVLLAARPASAASVGVNVNGAFAYSTFNLSRSSSSIDYSAGAGITLDTAVGADRFNFRFHFGYDNVIDSGSRFIHGPSMHRVGLTNIFGFGIVKTERARIWMGPEVGLSCQFNTIGKRTFLVIFHAGAVLGINLNAGDHFTFGIELGMRAGAGPNVNHSFIPPIGPYAYSAYSSRGGASSIAKVESFARVVLLFRAGSANEGSAQR